MADLLGSLLPAGYAAPDVQGILGGELRDLCMPCGPYPADVCYSLGTDPFGGCIPHGTGPSAYCLSFGSNPDYVG